MMDAPPELAGIVELDINLLDKDELIMLGMKQALDKYVIGFRMQANELVHQGTANVLREVADIMDRERHAITTELSARAIRRKAGTLTEIPRGKGS